MLIPQRYEFSSKSQPYESDFVSANGCCWYHKGTNFQANHNIKKNILFHHCVVADTTKVRIFKQITTIRLRGYLYCKLLLIPQRYEFSSKSQLADAKRPDYKRCCWYHKGTNFQANHNLLILVRSVLHVVADTTKVRIFKQITTRCLKH